MSTLIVKRNNLFYIIRSTHTVTQTTTTTNLDKNNNNTEIRSNDKIINEETQPMNIVKTTGDETTNIRAMITEMKDRINKNNATISQKENIPFETFNGNENTTHVKQPITPTYEKVDIPVINEEVSIKIKKIGIAMDVANNIIDENLKKKNIQLEKTEAATERSRNILRRTEQFLLLQPGRAAFYLGGGLALAWTVYNVIKYRQLPFSLYNIASKLMGSPTADASGMVATPPTSTIVNINYPSIPSSVTTSTSLGDVTPNLNWLMGGLLSGFLIALKYLKK